MNHTKYAWQVFFADIAYCAGDLSCKLWRWVAPEYTSFVEEIFSHKSQSDAEICELILLFLLQVYLESIECGVAIAKDGFSYLFIVQFFCATLW